jgi:hypothetical protein
MNTPSERFGGLGDGDPAGHPVAEQPLERLGRRAGGRDGGRVLVVVAHDTILAGGAGRASSPDARPAPVPSSLQRRRQLAARASQKNGKTKAASPAAMNDTFPLW